MLSVIVLTDDLSQLQTGYALHIPKNSKIAIKEYDIAPTHIASITVDFSKAISMDDFIIACIHEVKEVVAI